MEADAGIAAHRLDVQRILCTDMVDEIHTDDSSASSTSAEAFFESLPPLSLTDSPEDDQTCPICIDHYHCPSHSENAIRLV